MKSFTTGLEKLGIEIDKIDSKGMTTCFECSESRKQSNKRKKVLKVSVKTGWYKCYHCGINDRVDSDEWIEQQHGIETGLIKPSLSSRPVNPVKPTIKPANMKPFHTNPLTTQAIEYLNGRAISQETAEACKVAYNKGALCFNYYKDSEIVGAKYRLLKEKRFWQHVTPKKYLYNLNNLTGKETICLVEGEFDVLAIFESGFKAVGSVSQGAPNEGSEIGTKLQCLDNSIDSIKNAKKVIIWTDGDPNGRYLEKILVERFGSNRCSIVIVPEDLIDKETGKTCKDANSVLINYGKEKVKELIDGAKDTPISGVKTLRQVESEMWHTYYNGYRKGVKTGIWGLENHFSYYKPWWNLTYGIPNSGKSEFELFRMMCMAVKHGWKWACFVPEAYPAADFYNDCVMKLTGKGVDIDSKHRLTKEEYQVALDFVNEHFYFIYPQDDKDPQGNQMSNNFSNVVDKIKELKLSKGIDGFLIDPINQLSASTDFTGSKDEKLEQMYGAIDILCKTHHLSGNLIAHPRTLYDKVDGDYPMPTPYQVAGGAMNYNKAYTITCVHRPTNQSNKLNTLVEIDIKKVKKHKVAGSPACIDMHFDKKRGWYLDLDSTCALDGHFDELLQAAGITPFAADQPTNGSFREKMENENKSKNGYDLNKCPF